MKFLTIKEAANLLGVTPQTLRRWEQSKRLIPAIRTRGGQRRYDIAQISSKHQSKLSINKKTMCYARVSSNDQKEDLIRQEKLLELYCAAQGWNYSTIKDLGSGMNYHKKGLKKLLELLFDGSIERLVLTHKDRLLRFGAELIFEICSLKGIEIVIINQGNENSFEEELAQDVLEIITVFSARLYGARSKKNKQLMDKLTHVVQDNP